MVCIEAPAKINLHLDILEKRSDGYHDLQSIFQTVSLFDTLCVRSLKTEKKCTISGNFQFPQEDNIIRKAYDLYVAITGITAGIEVSVEKRIPIGAGLGGGSSDAAAALKSLELLFGRPLSPRESEECAYELGSDVLFFLEAPAAFVSGRGNILRPIPPRIDYEIIIVYPGFGISTKTAYKLLDDARLRTETDSGRIRVRDVSRIYSEDPLSRWIFDNSFLEVLNAEYPLLAPIIERLRSLGAAYSNITGSGSAVIAVFNKAEITSEMISMLRNEYAFVFYVKPLDKNPLPVLQ
jgi:4-diphosphocytidyl-2-C-methyl-D-erythritol kinase